MAMLTYEEIERLPEGDRTVTRALHDYYLALLSGAPHSRQQRLRQVWLEESRRRWNIDEEH